MGFPCKSLLCLTPFATNIVSDTVGFLISLLFPAILLMSVNNLCFFCFQLEEEITPCGAQKFEITTDLSRVEANLILDSLC